MSMMPCVLTCVVIFQRWLFIDIFFSFLLFFFFKCYTGFSVFEDEEGGKV